MTGNVFLATSAFYEGGRLNYRMEVKDGSIGFDFTRRFDRIVEPTFMQYHLDDDIKVFIHFTDLKDQTFIEVMIDAEEENTIALQKR